MPPRRRERHDRGKIDREHDARLALVPDGAPHGAQVQLRRRRLGDRRRSVAVHGTNHFDTAVADVRDDAHRTQKAHGVVDEKQEIDDGGAAEQHGCCRDELLDGLG